MRLQEQRLAERLPAPRDGSVTATGRAEHDVRGVEKRKALAWGGMLATWGARLFTQPRIRWLLATTLMSQLRRRASR